MIAGSSLQQRSSQHFTFCVSDLAVGRISILAATNGESYGAINGNSQRDVAITVAVTTICTAEGYTCWQC